MPWLLGAAALVALYFVVDKKQTVAASQTSANPQTSPLRTPLFSVADILVPLDFSIADRAQVVGVLPGLIPEPTVYRLQMLNNDQAGLLFQANEDRLLRPLA